MSDYKRVNFKSVEDFINMTNLRNEDDSNVTIMYYGPDNIAIKLYNDRDPTYWTSVDDEYVIFDSWNSAVESKIQANKTEVFVSKAPTLELDDATIIDLPSNLMSYLQAKLEANCFATINQQANPKSEQRESRNRVRTQRSKWRQGRKQYSGPNYGK